MGGNASVKGHNALADAGQRFEAKLGLPWNRVNLARGGSQFVLLGWRTRDRRSLATDRRLFQVRDCFPHHAIGRNVLVARVRVRSRAMFLVDASISAGEQSNRIPR